MIHHKLPRYLSPLIGIPNLRTIMRNLLLALSFLLLPPLFAQQEVKIADAKALAEARDVRKNKAALESLRAEGLTEEEISVIEQFGDVDQWPEGIRTDTARASNAPYIINYVGFRLSSFLQDTVQMAVVMLPAKSNIHMPEGMRPLGDFYMVLPERTLKNVEEPKRRPVVSRGPQWRNRAKVKILKPDELYAAYDLAADSIALRALAKTGMSKPEIDAVIFRSTERNWPEGIDNFEKRYPLLEKFSKYRAYLGARWDDKVLLIVPVEKNRRMPVAMRPYLDLYFVYTVPAVKIRGRK